MKTKTRTKQLQLHRRTLCVLLSLLASLLLCTGLSAQVTIGSGIPPVGGALLDMKETNVTGVNANKGMLLPRVALLKRVLLYPMFAKKAADGVTLLAPLQETGDYDTQGKKDARHLEHTGLMVYNTTLDYTEPLCPGIYIWDATSWVRMDNKLCSPAPTPTLEASISGGATDVCPSGTTTLTAFYTYTGAETVNYQWYKGASGDTGNPVGTNASTYAAPNTAGTTTKYWCKVYLTPSSQFVLTNDETVSVVSDLTVADPATTSYADVCYSASDKQLIGVETIAGGKGTRSYQWYWTDTNTFADTNAIPNETEATYYVPLNVAAGQDHYYWLVVKDDCNTGTDKHNVTGIRVQQQALVKVRTPNEVYAVRETDLKKVEVTITDGKPDYTLTAKRYTTEGFASGDMVEAPITFSEGDSFTPGDKVILIETESGQCKTWYYRFFVSDGCGNTATSGAFGLSSKEPAVIQKIADFDGVCPASTVTFDYTLSGCDSKYYVTLQKNNVKNSKGDDWSERPEYEDAVNPGTYSVSVYAEAGAGEVWYYRFRIEDADNGWVTYGDPFSITNSSMGPPTAANGDVTYVASQGLTNSLDGTSLIPYSTLFNIPAGYTVTGYDVIREGSIVQTVNTTDGFYLPGNYGAKGDGLALPTLTFCLKYKNSCGVPGTVDRVIYYGCNGVEVGSSGELSQWVVTSGTSNNRDTWFYHMVAGTPLVAGNGQKLLLNYRNPMGGNQLAIKTLERGWFMLIPDWASWEHPGDGANADWVVNLSLTAYGLPGEWNTLRYIWIDGKWYDRWLRHVYRANTGAPFEPGSRSVAYWRSEDFTVGGTLFESGVTVQTWLGEDWARSSWLLGAELSGDWWYGEGVKVGKVMLSSVDLIEAYDTKLLIFHSGLTW